MKKKNVNSVPKSIKDKLIKKLNEEILFYSRKNFSMFGNIQWSVEDIVEDTIIVKISSSRKDFGKPREDGDRVPTKKIAQNIKESIEKQVPHKKVLITWKKWNSEDGVGFLLSLNNKKSEDK